MTQNGSNNYTGQDKGHDGLIAEFLGQDASIGGPFAVLGLRYDPIDKAMILHACQARLMQINEHRRSQTPAADEVRLAVHAAGSQLLDPELRMELAKHWPEGTGIQVVAAESPVAWRVDTETHLDPGLLNQALTVLGACGGWNTRSRKRLGQFARMHQVSAAQLVNGILGNRDPRQSDGSLNSGGIAMVMRGPSLVDGIEGTLPWGLIPVAYAFMGLALISIGIITHEPAVRTATNPSSSIATSAESTTVNENVRGQSDQRNLPERRHYTAVAHELDQFRTTVVLDEESAKEFSELGGRLVEQWSEFPPEDLDDAVESARLVLAGIINPALFQQAGSFLAVPDDSRTESMLAAGLRSWMFGGTGREPAFVVFSERSQEILAAGSFDAHLAKAFDERAKKSTDDPEWWSWWIGQLKAFATRSATQSERALYASVYQRLVESIAGDPAVVDPVVVDQWERSARRIVQSVGWGEGDSSRGWMLGIVADPQVRSDRLAVLTKALVLYSSARGLGTEFVLNANDSMDTRELYLGKLRAAWDTGAGAIDEVRDRLLSEINIQLSMTRGVQGREQAVNRAFDLARLNTACWAKRADDQVVLHRMLDAIGTPMPMVQATGVGLDLASPAGDALWATNARNLTDADALLNHLDQLDRFDRIGPKSAHALVYLAMQAPDLQVRSAAERAMLVRPDEPAILIALDRIAGASRTTRRMVQLINEYVMHDGDPGDQAGTRQALLHRLIKIGMLQDNSSENLMQSFEAAMTELVGLRGARSVPDGARGVYEDMIEGMVADGVVVPSQVRAKLLIRLRKASGPMQRFIAYESAVLELMAFAVSNENPGALSRVEQILVELESRQLETDDAVFQMMLIERAMANLWVVLLEMEAVS
tara:strand:+ start:195220 stop:197859 length:2640 start_codon:yes stop_codon:yes gene_type:complete